VSDTLKRLVRRRELRSIIPLSDSHIWELERAGKSPKRIQLSPRCVAWDLDLILAWIEKQKAAGNVRSTPPNVHLRKTRPVRPCAQEAVALSTTSKAPQG